MEGIRILYLGGWATSAKGSESEVPGADLANYALDRVPKEGGAWTRAPAPRDADRFIVRICYTNQLPQVLLRPFSAPSCVCVMRVGSHFGGFRHICKLVVQNMDADEPPSTRGKGRKAVDAIGVFLRQVRKARLLTREEEISLFRTYRIGLKAQRKQENRDINTLALVERGEEAKQKLADAHLPLVMSVARSFYRTNRGHVDFEDLIGAANEGLTIALRRFDLKRGYRFSTYASWWIRNKIMAEIRQNRWSMHIPDRIYRKVLTLWRFKAHFAQEHGREPNLDEIARDLGLTRWEATTLQVWAEREIVSLDIPAGDDGESTLVDFIPGGFFLPDEMEDVVELHELTRKVISTLTPREEQVVRMVLGIGERTEHTITEAAQKFVVSRERLRQILGKSLRKLRHPSRAKRLRPFIEG